MADRSGDHATDSRHLALAFPPSTSPCYSYSYSSSTSSPASSSESPMPRLSHLHYSSERMSDSQQTSRHLSRSLSPSTSSLPIPVHKPEYHKLSSQTGWFHLPSVSHALQQYGDIRPQEPRFSLVIRQQPRRGLAVGSSQMALRTARSVPLDPPPVCELVVERAGDEQLLALPEVFLRAQLVQSDAPYLEVTGESSGSKLEPLVGDTLQSAFSSRIDTSDDQSFFVFKELGVRTRGIFRIRLDLFDRTGLCIRRIASVHTDAFEVHERRKHPGLSPSSSLMDALVERGMKCKLRKPTLSSTTLSHTPKKRKLDHPNHLHHQNHHQHHRQHQHQHQQQQQQQQQQKQAHDFSPRRDSWTPTWQPQETCAPVHQHISPYHDRRSSMPSITTTAQRPTLPSISQLYHLSRTSPLPPPPYWNRHNP